MNDLTIFKKGNVPTYDEADCNLVSVSDGMASGVKFIRLDGKEFVMVDGGVKTPIGKTISGVIIAAGPLSKRFYEEAFTGTNTHAPDCASADGEKPDAAIIEPICTSCETCPKNAWGSRAGYTGKQAKACQEYRRLVFCVTDRANNHMLYRLDVPAASLNNLRAYGSKLSMHRVPLAAVVTEISFDSTANYQKLAFDALSPFTKEVFEVYKELGKSAEAQNIITMQASAEINIEDEGVEEEEVEPPKPKRKKVVKSKKTSKTSKTIMTQVPEKPKKPKRKKVVEAYDDDDEVEEQASEETEDQEEPIKVESIDDLEDELDALIDMDDDDEVDV